jgi:hypothetical protein
MSKIDIDRHAIIQKFINKEISREYTAELLSLSLRQVTRLKQAVVDGGAAALVHKQRGQPSHNKLSEKEKTKIVKLLKNKYSDFGPTLAAEKLRENHKIKRDPKTIRAIQISEDLWKPRRTKKKSEHRAWRLRRSAFGELEQFDGSYHNWFEGRGDLGETCLLAAIDDATGFVVKLQFAPHEGVFPVFGFWKAYIETNGKPRAIYLDQFSTYKMNSRAAKENPDLKTQFERAMTELGVETVFALSPQAKGRVERLFKTLQDRLVKELRLKKISSVEEANEFLKKTFVPSFNEKFSVVPVSEANLHQKLTVKELNTLPAIFSRQEKRVVQNDFTFSFKNQWYQLLKNQPATVCKKDEVTVEEHLDHTIVIRLRGKSLNYELLPNRPKKACTQFVLPKTTIPVKPAANHPWRQRINAEITKNNL